MSSIIEGPFFTATHSAYPFPNAWGLHCGHYHRNEPEAEACRQRMNQTAFPAAGHEPYRVHKSEAVCPDGILSGGRPAYTVVD